MQSKILLSLLSIAIAASARPSPQGTTSSCDTPGSVVACCDSVATNGTGFGCIDSTLNILGTNCASGTTEACCSGSQTGLINLGCVPITVVV